MKKLKTQVTKVDAIVLATVEIMVTLTIPKRVIALTAGDIGGSSHLL
jgi:hypothetical protein